MSSRSRRSGHSRDGSCRPLQLDRSTATHAPRSAIDGYLGYDHKAGQLRASLNPRTSYSGCRRRSADPRRETTTFLYPLNGIDRNLVFPDANWETTRGRSAACVGVVVALLGCVGTLPTSSWGWACVALATVLKTPVPCARSNRRRKRRRLALVGRQCLRGDANRTVEPRVDAVPQAHGRGVIAGLPAPVRRCHGCAAAACVLGLTCWACWPKDSSSGNVVRGAPGWALAGRPALWRLVRTVMPRIAAEAGGRGPCGRGRPASCAAGGAHRRRG